MFARFLTILALVIYVGPISVISPVPVYLLCLLVWPMYCNSCVDAFIEISARQALLAKAVREWAEQRKGVVSICYHLPPHLEDLVPASVISQAQLDIVHRYQHSVGNIFGVHLLRGFIIANSTIDHLYRLVPSFGLDVADCQMSPLSSHMHTSSGDVEADDNKHRPELIPFLVLLDNEGENQPCLEDILQLEIISSFEHACIVDTREARGNDIASRLLLLILEVNQRKKDFLVWFASKYQRPRELVRHTMPA